jgi:anti-sigma-K factor RskA
VPSAQCRVPDLLLYHARLEPTLSELQAQIDRLSLAVHQGRETQGHLEPVAHRLAQLTEKCAEILNRWTETDRRHALAVTEVESRLGEWSNIEHRLQQDSAERLRELGQTIEQEWQSLRQVHDEPVKQLREQAAALGEICVSAANLALQGFERAEARIAALETNIRDQLDQMSLELRGAIADSRQALSQPIPAAPVAPFPLEGVMRIHDGLRETDDTIPFSGARPAADFVPDHPSDVIEHGPETALALNARMELLEREVKSEHEEVRETVTRAARMRRDWVVASVALGAALVAAIVFGISFQQTVNRRLDEAATRAAAAERQAASVSDEASRQIASTRAEAARQIEQARQTALRAGIVGDVLAAPDLLRYSLTGTDQASGANAQVLWSRSRGLVLSAARLPIPTDGAVYQLWLFTNTAPVSAGTFTPEPDGRVTFAIDPPANVPRPVTGVSVTLEPAGGQPLPSGPTVLARVQQ